VSAVSANDVWAVGSYLSERRRGNFPLTEHWDGTAWSIVPAPSPGPEYVFSSVTALAPDDVWAVGLSVNGLVGGPLAEHCDGSAWSIVDSANLGRPRTEFWGVGAAGASVRRRDLRSGADEHLAERWVGTSFQRDGNAQREWCSPTSAFAASSDGTTVWAVGDHGTHRGPHTPGGTCAENVSYGRGTGGRLHPGSRLRSPVRTFSRDPRAHPVFPGTAGLAWASAALSRRDPAHRAHEALIHHPVRSM
jgi:hypothetical protein